MERGVITMELWEEITHTTNTMEMAIRELKERGKTLAKAEYDYQTTAAEKVLVLRTESIPVTIIDKLVKGDTNVATMRMQRDIAEVLYKSCLEGINVYKLKLRILENQYQREWGAKE
jgi:hypothetical protein